MTRDDFASHRSENVYFRFSSLTLDLTEGNPGNNRRQQVVGCAACHPVSPVRRTARYPDEGARKLVVIGELAGGFRFGFTAKFGIGRFGFLPTSHHSTRTLDVAANFAA